MYTFFMDDQGEMTNIVWVGCPNNIFFQAKNSLFRQELNSESQIERVNMLDDRAFHIKINI